MKTIKNVTAIIISAALTACSAGYHQNQIQPPEGQKLTAGTVQREIHRGMSQGSVAESLGAPNIVSRDDQGRETWIYDRFATEATYSKSNFDTGFLGGVGGVVGSVLLIGFPSVGFNQQAGAAATTQRTLTVVIKFDSRSLVETATFHSSTF